MPPCAAAELWFVCLIKLHDESLCLKKRETGSNNDESPVFI